jgi:Zn-dependent peptidase ImmA (M78 family)
MKNKIAAAAIVALGLFFISACSQEEVLPAEPFYFVDDALKPYLRDYINECNENGTIYKIPTNFTLILTDSIGVANNLGSGVTLTYPNGKVRVLITDEMTQWSEWSRRYVIFHELGHALQGLEHQDVVRGIMNTDLYPTLDIYHESQFKRDYIDQNHFTRGL